MFYSFFSYYSDLVLMFYIFGGLLMGAFIRHKPFTTFLDEIYEKKKNFYIMTRGAIMAVLLHFFLVIHETTSSLEEPIFDSVGFFEFYQKNLTNELGSFFFRADFVTGAFILILNLCVLFYLVLLLNYLANTTEETRYVIEVPILIVTVFFAFKFFLLAYDFVLIIISLELASLCTLILLNLQITSTRNVFPIEAAIKYFLFNAVAVGFMLVAISGYYEYVQNFNLIDLNTQALLNPYFQIFNQESLLVLHLFFFFGYLMKLGSAPVHHWVPDVYEGVEFLLTAFLIVVVSPALNFKFFVFVKLLLPVHEITHISFLVFLIFGFYCMVIGVLSGLSQMRLKRFLAYASINHFGFILVSLGTPTFLGFFASLFYLFTYIVTNFAFFSLLLLTQQFNLTTYIYLNQLKGLLNYNSLLFGFFLIPLFSYAGFPPFAGFFGKLFVFVSLLDFMKIGLSVTLLVFIVLNAYIYLRFVKIGVFEQNTLSFYVPMEFTSVKLTAKYGFAKRFAFPKWTVPFRIKTNFFILFLLNILLLFFILFLPTTCLFISQLVMSLFIFF